MWGCSPTGRGTRKKARNRRFLDNILRRVAKSFPAFFLTNITKRGKLMKLNVRSKSIHTHEGAKAKHITPELALRRSVMACLLWEKSFYEDGVEVAKRISELIPKVDPDTVADIAVEARSQMYLRHVPLFIVREMAALNSHKHLVADTLEKVIQRADEPTEFLAMYWQKGHQPLSAQVKKGLAKAFTKFDRYHLQKYNRKGQVRLPVVLKMTHPKPKSPEQEKDWRDLRDGNLGSADTWEVALSSGGDKKAHWERLLSEKKLGGLALLRNLRNMQQAGVTTETIKQAINETRFNKVLPFRFIAAAKYAPQFEEELGNAMIRSLKSHEKLSGQTVLLVDVSGSMDWAISDKSDINRIDAACGLAMLLREICNDVLIYTFSENFVAIPPRRTFALRDAILNSQLHSGTYLGAAVRAVYSEETILKRHRHMHDFNGQGLNPKRLIVLTDEQSHDSVPDPLGRGYMINVASYKNGVGYGPWLHVEGWSENVVRYIQELEANQFA
jgi:hypothetical protein